MSRRWYDLGVAICLILYLVPSVAWGHAGDFVVPIFELPTSELPELDDGTLADWEEVLPGPSLDHTYASVMGGEPDPGDLAWRAYLAWHWESQQLYVGIERVDDVYDEEIQQYTGDRTTFRVDGDHSGGLWKDAYGSLASNAQQYWYSPAGRSASGELEFWFGARPQWPAQSPWADFAYTQYGEAPGQTVMEFYVTAWDSVDSRGPELSRRSALRPNAVIGIQLVLTDEDGPRDPPSAHWFPRPCNPCGLTSVDYAETFGDGQLIPCQVEDCSGAAPSTSVVAGSWGRIKASLR